MYLSKSEGAGGMLHTTPAETMVLDFRKAHGPIKMMTVRQKKQLKKLIAKSQKLRKEMTEGHKTWTRLGRSGPYGNFRHREVICSLCGTLGTVDSRSEATILAEGHKRLMTSVGEPVGEDEASS